MNREAAPVTAAPGAQPDAPRPRRHRTGSLTRRMIVVAALWIITLLLAGGFALDRVLTRSIVSTFDEQLVRVLNSMIASSEIDPNGEVRFTRPPADQRFIEAYSGIYFQISGAGADTFASRSLWDRRLQVSDNHNDVRPHLYDSDEFSGPEHAEPLPRHVREPRCYTGRRRVTNACNCSALRHSTMSSTSGAYCDTAESPVSQ